MSDYCLIDLDRRVLKSSMHFLTEAYEHTNMASGSAYMKISMQSLIFLRLLKLWDTTISGLVSTEFTTSVVKRAADALQSKLLKCQSFMCIQNNMIALILDPRSSNSSAEPQALKHPIRDIMRLRYEFSSDISLEQVNR